MPVCDFISFHEQKPKWIYKDIHRFNKQCHGH